jgi:hypothetical protein
MTLTVQPPINPFPLPAIEPDAQAAKPIAKKSSGAKGPAIVVPKGNLGRTPSRRKNIGSPPKYPTAPQPGSGSFPQLLVVGVSRRKMKFAPGGTTLPDLRND